MAEAVAIRTILTYCGFETDAQRNSIAEDGFESYADLLSLTVKDVTSLAKGFGERTTAQGRINFGMRRTNYLKATLHWAQDFRRVSRDVTLNDVNDITDFREQIEVARQRALIRSHNAAESDGLSKAADPGKLKRQKEWTAWSAGLANYLSTIQGQDGVPLAYIIRDNTDPDYELEDEDDFDFEQLSINCAPLDGLVFQTDARKVHQLIHGFVQGETAETWIKATKKKQNGRLDYLALQAHYGGEGNKSIRIKEAEVLRNNLTYKSERTMSFEKFLTSMQSMFTGFDDNDEVLNNAQKIRLLFQKVQSPNLAQVKSALKVQSDLDVGGMTVTYDFIANSLAAEATSSIDIPNRNASGLDSQGGKGSAPESGVKGPDGNIFTGYFPNWKSFSDGDKQIVYDERKRLGVTTQKKKTRRKTSSVKSKKKSLGTLTREIASLKTRVKDLKKRTSTDDDAEDDDPPQENAGDQFGGRKDKKQKKKKDD
jgi:hypothetical protein